MEVVTAPGGPKPCAVLLIEATIALKEESKSSPVSSIAKVSSATVMKYRKMNASTECAMPSGMTRPPMRTGAMAAG